MTSNNHKLTLHIPINDLSFGQVSIALLREIYKRNIDVAIFPIGPISLNSQNVDMEFFRWLNSKVESGPVDHSSDNDVLKLWHIRGGNESILSKGTHSLLTFHETDSLSPEEVNTLKTLDRVFVTSSYTSDVFRGYGLTNVTYIPLGFDVDNFHRINNNRLKINGTTSFLMLGKLEHRKSHFEILRYWAEKYGNKDQFRLNCAITNKHLEKKDQDALVAEALQGKQYYNINFINYCDTNAQYNTLLQSSDIVFALSKGEGFDLPVYHATALGALPIALNAHVYKDYLTPDSTVFVEPAGLEPAIDNIFFQQNSKYSVGNWFKFTQEAFNKGCDEAVARVMSDGKINIRGLDLARRTYEQVVSELLEAIQLDSISVSK